MPVCTLRQKIANIEQRLKAERLSRNTITEWQTRTLAQFIAATVPVEKGKRNPLADEAAKISLRVEDKQGKADDDRSIEEVIEKGSQTASNKNLPGSYERLMAGFGGGTQTR